MVFSFNGGWYGQIYDGEPNENLKSIYLNKYIYIKGTPHPILCG